jgi:hypothetical protein
MRGDHIWLRLDALSDYLASRQQFTLKAESSLEAVLTSGQKLQYDSPATLMVSRPNKLRAHRKGDIANQEFFYDGKTLTLYNPRENLYATTAAPATLDDISSVAAVATASPGDCLGSGHYPGYIHSFRVLHGLDLVAGEGRGGAS